MSFVIFFMQQILLFTVPLIAAGVAGMYCERSGIINIGLEGNMIIGAFTGCLYLHFVSGTAVGQGTFLMSMLIAGIFGAAYAFLHALASIQFKANQAVCGIALNMAAPAISIFLGRIVTGSQKITFTNNYRIEKVPVISSIPFIGDIFFQKVYITFYLAILIFVVGTIVINKTKFGMRIRACGENPHAADSVGINVSRIRYISVLICGFITGISGVMFVVPTSTEFNANVAGYGFLAVSVVILGRWRPKGILLAAVFFGITKTLAAAYSAIPLLEHLQMDAFIYRMVPFIATLLVLGLMSIRTQGQPQALGVAYDKGAR